MPAVPRQGVPSGAPMPVAFPPFRIPSHDGAMKIGSTPPAVFADPQQLGILPIAPVPVVPVNDEVDAAPIDINPNRIDPQQPHPVQRADAHKVSAASETLRAVKRDAEIARAHASQKLQDLKAQLHLVDMMHTGDPARHGQAVSQIARELAASVQGFISVGGTPIDLSAIDIDPIKDTAPPNAVSPTDPAVLVAAAALATTRGDVQYAATVQAAAAQRHAEAVDLTGAVTKVSNVTSVAVTVGEDPDAAFARDARALARDLKASVRRRHEQDGDDGDAAADGIDRTLASPCACANDD
jgi:hypothetical protein